MHTHDQISAVFCAFRVYAIWDREWTVFWTILLLYIAHTALFLVRPLLSSPERLILIFVKTPNILSGYEPIGPPFYGCRIAPETFRATDVIQ